MIVHPESCDPPGITGPHILNEPVLTELLAASKIPFP